MPEKVFEKVIETKIKKPLSLDHTDSIIKALTIIVILVSEHGQNSKISDSICKTKSAKFQTTFWELTNI